MDGATYFFVVVLPAWLAIATVMQIITVRRERRR
jgi:hypothetical protein